MADPRNTNRHCANIENARNDCINKLNSLLQEVEPKSLTIAVPSGKDGNVPRKCHGAKWNAERRISEVTEDTRRKLKIISDNIYAATGISRLDSLLQEATDLCEVIKATAQPYLDRAVRLCNLEVDKYNISLEVDNNINQIMENIDWDDDSHKTSVLKQIRELINQTDVNEYIPTVPTYECQPIPKCANAHRGYLGSLNTKVRPYKDIITDAFIRASDAVGDSEVDACLEDATKAMTKFMKTVNDKSAYIEKRMQKYYNSYVSSLHPKKDVVKEEEKNNQHNYSRTSVSIELTNAVESHRVRYTTLLNSTHESERNDVVMLADKWAYYSHNKLLVELHNGVEPDVIHDKLIEVNARYLELSDMSWEAITTELIDQLDILKNVTISDNVITRVSPFEYIRTGIGVCQDGLKYLDSDKAKTLFTDGYVTRCRANEKIAMRSLYQLGLRRELSTDELNSRCTNILDVRERNNLASETEFRGYCIEWETVQVYYDSKMETVKSSWKSFMDQFGIADVGASATENYNSRCEVVTKLMDDIKSHVNDDSAFMVNGNIVESTGDVLSLLSVAFNKLNTEVVHLKEHIAININSVSSVSQTVEEDTSSDDPDTVPFMDIVFGDDDDSYIARDDDYAHTPTLAEARAKFGVRLHNTVETFFEDGTWSAFSSYLKLKTLSIVDKLFN